MAAGKPPEPPGDLTPRGRGRDLWRRVLSQYDLRPDEMVVFAETCRMADLAVELRERVAEDGPTATGAGGHMVTHPLLVELRQVRQELRRSLSQLGLPDEAGSGARDRSERARDAALARWKRHA